MKKIFLSIWILGLALFWVFSQSNTLVFGAEKMMEKGATGQEQVETYGKMKKESGMMKEQEMMKKESGVMKEQGMMKKGSGTMKEQETMKTEGSMMKENR